MMATTTSPGEAATVMRALVIVAARTWMTGSVSARRTSTGSVGMVPVRATRSTAMPRRSAASARS